MEAGGALAARLCLQRGCGHLCREECTCRAYSSLQRLSWCFCSRLFAAPKAEEKRVHDLSRVTGRAELLPQPGLLSGSQDASLPASPAHGQVRVTDSAWKYSCAGQARGRFWPLSRQNYAKVRGEREGGVRPNHSLVEKALEM